MTSARSGSRFLVSTAVMIMLSGAVLQRPAAAQSADAYQVISMVNAVRASVGAPPVALDGALSSVAQIWAGVMAAAGTISHNPALGAQVSGWTMLAENVGMGASLDIVHQVLVGSPAHYANMTNSNFTAAGAGVASSGGQVFVVQVFMAGQAAPPPPSEPEPEPAPEPPPVRRAPAVAAPAPEPAPVPVPRAAEPATPTTTVPVVATVAVPVPPVVATGPSPYLALVLEQLQALDRLVGPRG